MKVLIDIALEGGNVVHVAHHREGIGLPFGTVEIDISVETRDADHAAAIAEVLRPYLSHQPGTG